jgi:hypothetical protein
MRHLALIGLLVVACQPAAETPSTPPTSNPPSSGPSPTASAKYPEQLLADLGSAGVETRVGQVFAADPFAAQGFLLCVGTEQVRMYVFPSIGDRVEATAKIDRTDPSNVGTAMISWNGRPRFWGVDRLLLLYLGEDVATEALLRQLLGPPFASGEGRALLPDPACS